MDILSLDPSLAAGYSSPAQKIRVMSEDWTHRNIACAACGNPIQHEPNNRPVLDFCCPRCGEQYELKSKKNAFGHKVVDGAHTAMLKKLLSDTHPNFFFLAYDMANLEIVNFFVVPSYFLHPMFIEKRRPLRSTARRAGWVGCNILLDQIPEIGRIHYVRQRQPVPVQDVLATWHRTTFLKQSRNLETKGWTLDVMRCVERIGALEFSLGDLYRFEGELKLKYPRNNFIKDKIRQQLQILRDQHYLEFKGAGKYRIIR